MGVHYVDLSRLATGFEATLREVLVHEPQEHGRAGGLHAARLRVEAQPGRHVRRRRPAPLLPLTGATGASARGRPGLHRRVPLERRAPRAVGGARPAVPRPPAGYQPRARQSGTAGRSAPTVVSAPWPG